MRTHPLAPSPGRRRAPAVAVAVAAVLNGCYDYVAPLSGTPAPGTEIQANLTDAGSVQMSGLLGPRVVAIDGQVERASTDSLVLRVKRITLAGGAENDWSGEQVAIPAAAVATVRERQLSRPRTILAATVIGGAVIAAWLSQHIGTTPEPPVVVGPPPTGQ